jgi:hypothetical protein
VREREVLFAVSAAGTGRRSVADLEGRLVYAHSVDEAVAIRRQPFVALDVIVARVVLVALLHQLIQLHAGRHSSNAAWMQSEDVIDNQLAKMTRVSIALSCH